MSDVGDSGQRGEVQLDSFPTHCVSGHEAGFPCFQGFSLPAKSGEASLNRRRIPVLRRAASVILAGSAGCSLLSHPSCSRGSPSQAVSPVPPSPFMGSPGRLRSCSLERLLLPRPPVVAEPSSAGGGCLSSHGGPRSLLLV